MSNQQNLKNLVDQANSLLRQTQTLLSGEDSRQLAGQIANVVSNVPRTWNDRNQTISQFVTDLVNKSLGLDGTLNLTLKNTDPSADATDFSNWMVTQARAKNPGSGVTLDQVVNAALPENPGTPARSVYASTQSSPLPENPETGKKTDDNQLGSLAESIFWAAYDIINTKKQDQYRWGTQTTISLPGTNIQNISVDLAALLDVLPEANNMVARSMPSNSGMGAGYAIQDASDSLRIVLNSIAKQNGSPVTTSPVVEKPIWFNYEKDYPKDFNNIFGTNTSSGVHIGIDYNSIKDEDGVAVGLDIASINDGEVVYVDNSNTTGNGCMVVIEHNINGVRFYSSYSHLKQNSIKVVKGALIKGGTVFATMGNTGKTSSDDPKSLTKGRHLHLMVYSSNDILKSPDGHANERAKFGNGYVDMIVNKGGKDMAVRFYDPKKVIDSGGQFIINNKMPG